MTKKYYLKVFTFTKSPKNTWERTETKDLKGLERLEEDIIKDREEWCFKIGNRD